LPGRAGSAKAFAEFFDGVSLYIPRQGCLNNLHLLSGNDGVGRIDDDLIVRLEASNDLDLIAEIVARSYGGEHDFPVSYDADM
jgi:hypothetical protein